MSLNSVAPRDFCLVRYAKQNIDGSFVICLDSTSHEDCPIPSEESDDHIRAELHAVYVISPPRHADLETDGSMFFMESLLTFIAQVRYLFPSTTLYNCVLIYFC